jgi:long-chain acyl-CoA synthetase
MFTAIIITGGILTKDDIHISYLPLAHVFERAMYGLFLGVGARIGFYQGDTLKLLDDVAELRPTFFASVPRLFNRIYDKVWAQVKAKGGVSEALFNYAFNSKKANLEKGVVTHPIWE